MAHRINERNSGNWTLDGEPKRRKASQKLTREEEMITVDILERVLNCLEYDRELSNGHGPHHAEATFRDNGDFIISMDRQTYEQLCNVVAKLEKRYTK